jgi:uncharacterized protein (DUF2164 family)
VSGGGFSEGRDRPPGGPALRIGKEKVSWPESAHVYVGCMPIELSKEDVQEILPSLKKYFREEIDQDLSDMRAKFLLGYFMQEIAPFAYNKGVKDAEAYFRSKVEDLPATCFEDGLTYWKKRKK